MRKLLILLLLPINTIAQKDYPELLRSYMSEQVNEGFSGSVLIVKNDKVLLRSGYGLANREWNMPNGPGVKYRIGSISKQFTAFSILKLAEEGKLRLDDKLSKYIPEFPKGDSVTIGMLLTHTSGIADMVHLPEFADNIDRLPWSKDSIIHFIEKKGYYFSPGARFDYCNTGYFLLAYIVEKASGETFRHYLRTQILDPLGLHDTGVNADDSVVSRMAQGYQMTDNSLLYCDFIDKSWLFGSGQVYSTIDDLYKWEKAYTSNAVLSEAYRKMIFSTGVNHPSYGFGIGIDTFMNHVHYWHTGDESGFDSYAGRFVNDGTYVILLSNDQFIVQRMKEEIGHILFDTPEYLAAQKALFNQRLSAANNVHDRQIAIWHLNQLKAMESTERQPASALFADTGSFGNGMYFFVRGRSLYCRGIVRDNNLALAQHISGDLFQLNESLQVKFVKNSTGKVIGLWSLNAAGYENYWPIREELEKNKLTWEDNKAKAGQTPMPDSSVLAGYAGTYAGWLAFSPQGTEFIGKDIQHGDRFTLRYISGSLFQIDNDAQVEFEKGQGGTVTAIRLYWVNGMQEVIQKDK
jgi:CubicO group peptidase (beta-lactamase class C family)